MTKNELCIKILMYAESKIMFQEVVDAIDAYSLEINKVNVHNSNSPNVKTCKECGVFVFNASGNECINGHPC